MRSTIIAAGFVLGSVIALPHDHHDSKHHGKYHGASLTGIPPFGTGLAPLGTGTATAPYGTGIANSTGRFHPLANNGNQNLESAMVGEGVIPTPAAAIQDKHATNGGGDCNAATVTVTSNSVVTVTVGGSDSGAAAQSSASAPKNVAPSPVGPAKGADLGSGDTGAAAAASKPSSSSPKSSPNAGAQQSNGNTQQSPKAGAQQPSSNTQQSASSNEQPRPAKAASSSAAPATRSTTAGTSDTAPTNNTSSTGNSAPAGGQPFKTKRGIIASGAQVNALAAAFGNTKLSWLGNWYSGAPPTLGAGLTFVPQNYGKQSDVDGTWTKNAPKAIAAGDKYFFSFGEPGMPNDKLHMEPAEAVALWKKEMEPYAKQGVSIGAPGTLQDTNSFKWLNEFLDLCTDCTIGFIALHWFDKTGANGADKPAAFKETVNNGLAVAKRVGKPLWVDNFSLEADVATQKAFLGDVVPWLDSFEGVVAYGYVPPDVGKAGSGANMVDGSGKLNDLGQYYASL